MTPTGQQLVDTTSRTHLLLARTGAVETLEQAQHHLAQHRVLIRVGAAACTDPFGQAALLTTTLACRASLTVTVDFDDPAAAVLIGPWRRQRLIETAHTLGAFTATASDPTPAPVRISIGQPSPPATAATHLDLQVTWDGWIAAIRPAGVRLPERHGTIMAAVAAAAFAVSEVFHQLTGHLDAGWRDLTYSGT